MKKFFISLSVLALGFMASCQQEEVLNETSQLKAGLNFTATFEESIESRTQLSALENNTYKVLWSANDNVSIFASENIHAQYAVADGVGSTRGTFTPVGGDKIEGTDNEVWNDDTEMFVGVYPYAEGTTVAKNEKGFTVNTVIPTKQAFAAGSFAKDASPMVAVSEDHDFAFKNIGTIIVLPLKGEVKIVKATLTSKKHNIAGKAVVTVEGNNWIPTADVTNGENAVVVDCGEGVQLKADEATNFYFVFAPGTYEAEDLSIKFTDSHYNYDEFVIPVEHTYKRSGSATFKAHTYEAQGVEKDAKIWIKADAAGFANAERVIPSVDNLNYIEWIKSLACLDKDETVAKIESAILNAKLGNYKGVYDILGSLPGFVKETRTFNGTGTYKMAVSYTMNDYIAELTQEIADIDSADEFVEYVKKLSIKYQDFESTLDNGLGNLGDLLGNYVPSFNLSDILGSLGGSRGILDDILGGLDLSNLFNSIKDINITKLLLDNVENKDGFIYKTVSKLFENPEFVKMMQEALVKAVKEAAKLDELAANLENVASKEAAIEFTKNLVISEAQNEARLSVEAAIEAANKANLDKLNSGPWGLLKKVIAWEPCVNYFNECGLTKVHTALEKLCGFIEGMISYERIDNTQFEVAKEDYVEGVNYWVIKYESDIEF